MIMTISKDIKHFENPYKLCFCAKIALKTIRIQNDANFYSFWLIFYAWLFMYFCTTFDEIHATTKCKTKLRLNIPEIPLKLFIFLKHT